MVRARINKSKENQRARPPHAPKTLNELESELLQSIERFDRGEGVDGDAVFRRLRKKIKDATRVLKCRADP